MFSQTDTSYAKYMLMTHDLFHQLMIQFKPNEKSDSSDNIIYRILNNMFKHDCVYFCTILNTMEKQEMEQFLMSIYGGYHPSGSRLPHYIPEIAEYCKLSPEFVIKLKKLTAKQIEKQWWG
jgi:hypothetical protein